MKSKLSPLLIFVVLGSAILIATNPVNAQSSNALSDAERSLALKIEEQSTVRRSAARIAAADRGIAKLAKTAAGREGKTVVVSTVPMGSTSTLARVRSLAPKSAVADRRALVTRFDYATGITTRTTVDLNSGKTLGVRSSVNYPTPLAPEELQEAITLLRSAVPKIDSIAREAGTEDLKYDHLTPVSPNAAAPRYGHRLVILWVWKPVTTGKYLVDLSTKQVVKAQ